ncbi:hypothetical protein DFJ66_0258 [Saccharothrix variisporea]|uniref:Uncharacterized protein n=1 Tax=Saccharothrix variisporea TaxID=543527 RepID=A0A495WZP4_9PSEU|nr:hypothetical protein DFJ66_0258 [Saccharothrix variisporea]
MRAAWSGDNGGASRTSWATYASISGAGGGGVTCLASAYLQAHYAIDPHPIERGRRL